MRVWLHATTRPRLCGFNPGNFALRLALPRGSDAIRCSAACCSHHLGELAWTKMVPGASLGVDAVSFSQWWAKVLVMVWVMRDVFVCREPCIPSETGQVPFLLPKVWSVARCTRRLFDFCCASLRECFSLLILPTGIRYRGLIVYVSSSCQQECVSSCQPPSTRMLPFPF